MWSVRGRHVAANAARGARALAALLLIATPACTGSSADGSRSEPTTLRVGYGLAAGASPEIGIRQVARFLSLEGLVVVGADGKPLPRLAESWAVSDDGLRWRLRLRPTATFHTGRRVDAEVVRAILQKQLPGAMGPAFEDVATIRAVSDRELEIQLKRRSAFLMELLDTVAIEEPGSPLSGAGPFHVDSQQGDVIRMARNETYYAGQPTLSGIEIKPYTSVRGAWADMLRGRVDVLYEVGVEALDSLQSSKDVKVFSFQRGYAYLLLLNLQRPALQDAAFRRALNAAIDRDALVADSLRGHGTPARGPVSPSNWAYSTDLPQFRYQPTRTDGDRTRRLSILFDEPALERLALVVQRQLQAIGVDVQLNLVPQEDFAPRVRAGDFDAVLTDFFQGPNLARPYLYWHTGAPFNFGHYRSPRVDAALDSIHHAANDTAYKAGVAEFQRAIVDDPPAVFLAWSERARAVSTRFQVPTDVDGDILRTVQRWRPAGRVLLARRN